MVSESGIHREGYFSRDSGLCPEPETDTRGNKRPRRARRNPSLDNYTVSLAVTASSATVHELGEKSFSPHPVAGDQTTERRQLFRERVV